MLSLALLGALSIGSVTADDWDIGLGGGVFVVPEYFGSEDLKAFAFPTFDIAYKDRVFFNFYEGFSGYLYRDQDFRLKATLGWLDGRDEDDDNSFEGLGDIDDAQILKLSAEFQLGRYTPFFSIQKQSGGTDGVQAQMGIQGFYALREQLTGPLLLLNLAVEYSDQDHLAGFFGIDAEQSARTGIPRYSPDAGISTATAGISYVYPFAEKWRFTSILQYSKILGDAADSPLVMDDKQLFGGAFVSYRY